MPFVVVLGDWQRGLRAGKHQVPEHSTSPVHAAGWDTAFITVTPSTGESGPGRGVGCDGAGSGRVRGQVGDRVDRGDLEPDHRV